MRQKLCLELILTWIKYPLEHTHVWKQSTLCLCYHMCVFNEKVVAGPKSVHQVTQSIRNCKTAIYTFFIQIYVALTSS